MNVLRALLIVGTRPEAIKIAPVFQACKQKPSQIEPIVCFTGQHRQMLAQVGDYFGIQPDVDLQLMQPNQTLAGLTARCLEGIEATVLRYDPDCIVAQGDTTTVMAASMASFFRRIPFVHVEAGLRTGNLNAPWPEEFNRRVAGISSSLHCAPTERAAQNLLSEGADPRSVHVTGNTVVDALQWTIHRERQRHDQWSAKHAMLAGRRMILITGHRRENFGERFESICRAISELASRYAGDAFVYPVHLNPNVREPVYRMLGKHDNVYLIEPASYPEFVWLMDRAALILTDSGGVQEEAPTLQKPVLVMRDTTERPEAVESGVAELVGTCQETIVLAASRVLDEAEENKANILRLNPYGDGHAAARIVDLMLAQNWARKPLSAKAA